MEMDQKIILGDAYKLIKDVPSGSVDLVFKIGRASCRERV